MATDTRRWGHSLGNLAELWLPVLDAAAPRSVVEIGAYAGDVTRILLDWAQPSGARIFSIDPEPQAALVELADKSPLVELARATSLEALPTIPSPDAVIIDGDHNYYTVGEELRLVDKRSRERAADAQLPLIICHDVCWPHGRRDVYYSPELIPEQHRQRMVDGAFLFPGDPGLHSGGLPYKWPAVREGGPRNGVLTAVEDFLEGREDLRHAIVPAFFGMAIIWPRGASWADGVGALLDPWDRNALLQRLEANRVLHLARWELEAARAAWCGELTAHKDAFLRRLLQSNTLSLAIWLSRLRRGGEPAFAKKEIRELLGD